MKELEMMLFDLLQDRKKRVYLICGAALFVVLVALLLATILGGSGRKYNRYYNEAERAYLAGDYSAAEEKLRHAMDLKSTEKAYLLMADIYCAEGDTDRAIQLLYLGYSHIGGQKIEYRLEELKSGRGDASPLPLPQENVTIAGKTMDSAITSLVLTGTRLKADDLTAIASLSRLESLGVSDCAISELDFLTGLSGLTFLQISDNTVRDLTPVAGLKNLKTLYIDSNPISDLTPLYGLSALRTLSMKGISLRESQLTALREALPECSIYADEPDEETREITLGGKTFRSDVTELDLGGLALTDISPLSACSALEKLDLRDNQISDLSPLVELPNLKWLCIWNNKVTDINPLFSLGGMEYLDADGNEISDISVLEYLPELKDLWLNNNPLKSIEPLQNLTELTRLGLAGTGLEDEDLELLTRLTSLKELNIKGNDALSAGAFETLQEALKSCEISHDDLLFTLRLGELEFRSDAAEIRAAGQSVSDLSGLEKFTALQTLDLTGNRVSDLTPLRDLTKLTSLLLSGNDVSDLTPLAGLPALRTLSLRNNLVQDLAPLAACRSLQTLDLSGNGLNSIAALETLTGLQTLDLSNNSIRDLSALYTLTGLRTLDLRGNPLSDDDLSALRTMLPDCSILAAGGVPGPASGTDLH